VVAVERDSASITRVVAPHDLPQPRDTGLRCEICVQVPAVALPFLANDGTRADEAHIALKNIPQLRQLIETGTPQEAANGRDPWVVPPFVIPIPLSMQFWIL